MELNESIIKRYSDEPGSTNLSCGGNLEFAEIQAGEVIFDLGCGRGAETIRVALKAFPGKAFGLDITPKMLEIGKRQAETSGVSNIEFVQCSFDDLPFENSSADVVMSNCAINHAPRKDLVYREIFRVLKPGGRFVVSDIVSWEDLPPEISSDPEAVAACFGGAITREQYLLAIKEAGFTDLEVLKERSYLKNGFGLTSLTLRGFKAMRGGEIDAPTDQS